MNPSFQVGALVDGKYRVVRTLGEGGVGVVLEALHVQLQQAVAIKILRPAVAEAHGPRFLREARASVRLRSEHVARVTDVGESDGAPYMVMELLRGRDLSELIEARGRLPAEEAADLLLQAIEGIAEAHAAGIVHRDIKPANLFVTERPDGTPLVKVLDFGISKANGVEDGTRTSTQVVMGSPLYMAPEQMRSTKDVDARADIWSLGVTLYEAVTGKLPFADDNFARLTLMVHQEDAMPPSAHLPGLDPRVDAIVATCLRRDADERYPHVGALAVALGAIASPDAHRHVEAAARMLGGMAPARRSLVSLAPPPTGTGEGAAPAEPSAGPEPGAKKSMALPLTAFVFAAIALAAGVFLITRPRPQPLPPRGLAAAEVSSHAPAAPASSSPPSPSPVGSASAVAITPALAETVPPSAVSATAKKVSKVPASPGEKPPPKGGEDPFGTGRK